MWEAVEEHIFLLIRRQRPDAHASIVPRGSHQSDLERSTWKLSIEPWTFHVEVILSLTSICLYYLA